MNDNCESHPSYGMIGIFRKGGTTDNLFGSAIKRHHSTVSIKIVEATKRKDLSGFFYNGSNRTICEIEMSCNQFAELITTPNMNFGVPCTIRYTKNGEVEIIDNPPNQIREVEIIKSSFIDKIKDLVKSVSSSRYGLLQKFESKKIINKTDRKEIISIFDGILIELRDNIPHIIDMLNVSADKITTATKFEISNFITQRTKNLNKLLPIEVKTKFLSDNNKVSERSGIKKEQVKVGDKVEFGIRKDSYPCWDFNDKLGVCVGMQQGVIGAIMEERFIVEWKGENGFENDWIWPFESPTYPAEIFQNYGYVRLKKS